MISDKKIKLAVNNLLNANFPAKVTSKDVKEGFKRPSFFVEFHNEKRSGSLSQIEKSKTIRIYYFPSENNDTSIELLDVKEQLGEVFDLKLPVENRYLDIVEANSDITDGVLQFEFDIDFEYGRESEFGETNHNPELMKDLDIDIKKG